MKELIIKKEKNIAASKEEFIADLDILFAELKNSYGGYEHFGEERFLLAKENIVKQLESGYSFETAVSTVREEFTSFIFDGHFSVDGIPLHHRDRKRPRTFDYAVKVQETEGIPVFDIKKFYYDTEEEKRQLENFAKSGIDYKNCPYLIFDLRMNNGGSDSYLWEFIMGLTGEEPEPPMDFLQKNSDTFLEVLRTEYDITDVEPGIETYRTEGKSIASKQRIYVLIDRYVSSSGESAIANLKTIEGTVVLGENSGGCYFSGNCMDIFLPHTGLCVYYGTGRVLYNGTQNIDELGGFAPDIYGEFEVADVVELIKNKKAVIFDMFETLITHFKSPLYFGKQIAEDMDIPEAKLREIWDPTDYDRTIGKMTLEEVFEQILRASNKYDAELVQKLAKKRTDAKIECFNHLHEEIIPMFEALKKLGYKIGLISNCYFEEAEVIKNSVLWQYFDVACLSCERGVAKPEEEIFRQCAEELGVTYEECLYVGDGGSHELETAKHLGMKPVQAVWYLQQGTKQPVWRKPEFLQAESPLEVLWFLSE